MGMDAEAELWYGYLWEAEVNPFEGSDADEWEDIIFQSRGQVDPWDSAPNFGYQPGEGYQERQARVDAWCAENREALDVMYAAKKAIREEFAVKFGRAGSSDYPSHYLFIEESKRSAEWGEGTDVTDLVLSAGQNEDYAVWRQKLNKLLTTLGIEKPHELPRWWLTAYYG
jgi:hypothetical protein